MARELIWVERYRFRGLACSARGFKSSGPFVGDTIEEMKRKPSPLPRPRRALTSAKLKRQLDVLGAYTRLLAQAAAAPSPTKTYAD